MKTCKIFLTSARGCPARTGSCKYPSCMVETSELRAQLHKGPYQPYQYTADKAALNAAEAAADRYDGLGAPMNGYSFRPHVETLRRQILGPDFNGIVRAIPSRSSCEPLPQEGEEFDATMAPRRS